MALRPFRWSQSCAQYLEVFSFLNIYILKMKLEV